MPDDLWIRGMSPGPPPEPVIRATTMREKLAEYFDGSKFKEEPGVVSMMAMMLPNFLPGPKRGPLTALKYLRGAPEQIPLVGHGEFNSDLLGQASLMQHELGIPYRSSPRTINLDDVVPTQSSVHRDSVADYVEQIAKKGRVDHPYVDDPSTEYLPQVTHLDDKFFVDNGHHRLSAEMLQKPTGQVEVEDMQGVIQQWLQQRGPDKMYQEFEKLLRRFRGER